MPKKFTYSYIKDFIEKEGYQLLSKEYKNTNTPLHVKCDKGHRYETKFNYFKQGKRCPYCAGNKKLTYEYVKDFIEKEGYQLLSKEYKNNRTKLLIKCPIGHEYKVFFGSFQKGQKCPYCYGNKKLTYNYVKSYIESFGYQLLSKEYKNTNTPLHVKCDKGHEYNPTFGNFYRGQRCLICVKRKKHTYGYIKDFIEKEDYQLLSDNYVNAHTKLLLKCPIGHEYEVKFNKFQQGQRCPFCANKIKHTYEYIKEYIKKEGYQLLSDNYVNAHTKLLLKCPIGHEYEVKFNYFQQGSRCSICSGNKKLDYEYIKSFVEKEGYQLLSKEYKNNHTKLLLKCPIGHEYEIGFYSFKKGIRCSVCNGNKKLSYKDVKSFIEEEGYTLLSDDYINCDTKLLLKCPIGHEYKVGFYCFKKGVRCPICWNESTSSKQERELQDYIESLGYNIIRNDRTEIINPLTGHNLELDIWIPDKNKAIEYNGAYWHDKSEQIKRDKIKMDQCKQKGIDLLIVKEYNWANNKQMEQDIINNFLNGGVA